MKLQLMKVAWVRDDAPAGQPAGGRFNCPCGNAVRAVYGQPDTVRCSKCGTVYDGRGWIVSSGQKEASRET